MKTLEVYKDSAGTWFRLLKFSYHTVLKDYVKGFPGSKWLPAMKAWRVPRECLGLIEEKARKFGFKTKEM